MRGHDAIERMRSAGLKPACIFIEDVYTSRRFIECGTVATVCTYTDKLEDIDLRFVVGCMVSIRSITLKRSRALAEMAKKEGATSVAWCCGNEVSIWHKDTGEVNG